MTETRPDPHLWWQRGVIYHIYPRSFMDSNDDGVGDLPGIVGRLDYLQWLGVDAIWLSPIFPSPMADLGYDVSDYTDIHPLFGTLADFDTLVDAAHRRGLKVILDYVPNHTSDRHPWFIESRSSRHSPRRDWYIWRDPAPDGGPPNNWRSVFGGSTWEWDATTGQYYYHAYLKEQPDLNWRNAEVRGAMLDVLRFWLDRGVDGFRVDALRQLIKDEQLRDNPPNPAYEPRQGPYHALLPVYTTDRPEVLDMIALMRRIIDHYRDRLLIGELYLPIERLVAYYGVNGTGVHLPFNFHLILVPWNARRIEALIAAYEAALPPDGWPNWVLGNHDQPRLASRIGLAQARVAAMLLLTLRGTPTLYYGDEIGMRNVAIPPELVQDPWEKNVPGLGLGRDPERTPMQWDDSLNAGFTAGTPWLPLAADYPTVNVAIQRDDPSSLLALYRRLIALRRATPALAVGTYTPIAACGDVLTYVRTYAGQQHLIALNLGSEPQRFEPQQMTVQGRLVLSTHLDRTDEAVCGAIDLRGDEGVLVLLG
ncbi:MAG TPA: alpha-amylase family glycosyl hydrolase [Alphaproteobacteria bacterium]|nr:alpha-amylase family glycosyl hydrolase [Alphaproteobacteria bacterium]